MMNRSTRFLFLGSLLVTLLGCGGAESTAETSGSHREAGAGHQTAEGEILVLAAASLSDVFGDIALAFEANNAGANVRLTVAGSSALREQILEGAPADVFASANESTMGQIVAAGDVATGPQIFATNELAIAVPAGNPGGLVGLEDFDDDDLFIGLCAEGVPCGDFARQTLASAGVDPSVDTNEPDVRALLTKIRADELDAGIVYRTDILAAGDEVESLSIPTAHNTTAMYPIATLAAAPNDAGATAFVAFVRSDEGRAILAAHGFGQP